MALRLTLKPHERVIIGGAALRNGDARAELLVENTVPVLRESDILSPAAVRTPCERVYLALQLAYVDAAQQEAHMAAFQSLVRDVLDAAPSCAAFVEDIEARVREDRLYQALKSAQALLQHEKELFRRV